MLSGIDEPECPQPRRVILSSILGAVTPTPPATCADDAPYRQATKVLARATIHVAVTGATTARRERSHAATLTCVGAHGAIDRANSIAVN
jgi:hypothetical protein